MFIVMAWGGAAWGPTGSDQGRIKPCLVSRRLSKLVADCFESSGEGSVSIHNENAEERQRQTPGEHELGPSWSPLCLFFLFLLFLTPKPNPSQQGRDVIKTTIHRGIYSIQQRFVEHL